MCSTPKRLLCKWQHRPYRSGQGNTFFVDCRDFTLPQTGNTLLVETSGGLLSPMDDRHTMADCYQPSPMANCTGHASLPGSINHTLLCLEVMRQRQIPLACLSDRACRDKASGVLYPQLYRCRPCVVCARIKSIDQEQVARCAAGNGPLLQSIFDEQY